MQKILMVPFFLMMSLLGLTQTTSFTDIERITSEVDSVSSEGLILKQSFIVNTGIKKVWEAYSTKEGWEAWATSIAEIDWQIGGTIKTNYNPNGVIGDKTTITLRILDFELHKMIRLQAVLTSSFPDFMRRDEKDLYNEILFERVSPNKTKVISYGMGYKKTKEYQSMMEFFIKGNTQSYLKLIAFLENDTTNQNDR